MKWFKHDTGSFEDPDFNSILDEFGDAGYVMFFGLLEIYGAEFINVDPDGFLKVPFSLVRRKLRKNRVKIELFLNFCQESLSKPRFIYHSNGKSLSYKVPKFIHLASNWTSRQNNQPTEVPTEVPTAIELEVDIDKDKVSKDTFVPPPQCPHVDIINMYHNILPEMPKIKVWDDTAKKWLRSRWKEDPERQNLSWWGNYFTYIRTSPFLMGLKKDWMADLRWLVRTQNFTKVCNGVYHKDTQPHDIQPKTYAQAQDLERRMMVKMLKESQQNADNQKSDDGGIVQTPHLLSHVKEVN